MASRNAGRGTLRSLEKNREINPALLFRDTRIWYQRLSDFYQIWLHIALLGGILGVVFWSIPGLSWFGIFTIPLLWLWRYAHPEHLPMRLPVSSQQMDFNDPVPGRSAFRQARGIFYIGNDMRSGEELWAAREDILTHMLLFGTTGAGKTYSLTGLTMNYLLMGGGLAYIDAKAVVNLSADIMMGACHLGREDDLLLLNFITGSATIKERSRNIMSNTSNFMRYGAAAGLSDLMVSLLSGDDNGGGNSVFRDRAIGLMKSLMMPLVDIRDAGLLALGPNTIRSYMNLGSLMSLSAKCYEKQMAISTKKTTTPPATNIKNKNAPPQLSESEVKALFRKDFIDIIRPASMEALDAYLKDLPGFSFEKPANAQSDAANEQFGYAQMYWSRALGMLSDTYRHIYWTSVGEIDMKDVVSHCRIMISLLPPLEKSKDELQSLGKLVLSAVKAATAVELPSIPTGLRKEVERPMPVASFGLLMDEYAYINTPGFAVLPAQARGLGIGLIYAGQDYAGFKNADENEAEQVISNTNIKFAMKLEDPQTTFTLFKELAGEGVTRQVAGLENPAGRMLSNYNDNRNVNFETTSRINFLDLKSQIEGEAFIFHGDKIIPAFLFSHMFKKNKNQILRIQKTTPLLVVEHAAILFDPLVIVRKLANWQKKAKSSTFTHEDINTFNISEDIQLKFLINGLEPQEKNDVLIPPQASKDWLTTLAIIAQTQLHMDPLNSFDSNQGPDDDLNLDSEMYEYPPDEYPHDEYPGDINNDLFLSPPAIDSRFTNKEYSNQPYNPHDYKSHQYKPNNNEQRPDKTYLMQPNADTDNDSYFNDEEHTKGINVAETLPELKTPNEEQHFVDKVLQNARSTQSNPTTSINQPTTRTKEMETHFEKINLDIKQMLTPLTDKEKGDIFDENN